MSALTPPVFVQSGGETAQVCRLAVGAPILTSGVLNPADLLVTVPGGTMTVSVAAGQGWLVGSRTNQGAYHVVNDAPLTVTIAASDPSNPRYDRIVAQIQDAAYSGTINSFSVAVIQGTPASSPVEPAIPADSFELCRVTVGAAVTTLNSGNLLDRRARAVQRGTVMSSAATADPTFTVKRITGQTGAVLLALDENGGQLAAIAANGNITAGSGAVGSGIVTTGALYVNNQQIQFNDRGSNATTPPAGNGYLYVVGGVLRYTAPSGTVTNLAGP